MDIINDSDFADFLTKRPLYYKLKVISNFEKKDSYSGESGLHNKPFKFKCPNEKDFQTFRTELMCSTTIFGFIDPKPDDLPPNFDSETKYLNVSIPLLGKCQSCGQSVHFFIRMFSDKPWTDRANGINIYLQKIGQFPPYEITPDKVVEKYLLEDDFNNYKKALVNLSISYGIGAYSYFRRIIENEILRVIEDLTTIDFDGVENVKTALNTFKSDHQMSNLIDVINKFLPKSLIELGDNPIRLLYEQLSGGIHKFTDEECLQKAQMIDVLLTFVIKKINEEKSQIILVREAMKKLRNGC